MLPALPFSILMPALSLLLVFRTNTGYSRWNEAHPSLSLSLSLGLGLSLGLSLSLSLSLSPSLSPTVTTGYSRWNEAHAVGLQPPCNPGCDPPRVSAPSSLGRIRDPGAHAVGWHHQ